MRGRQTRYWKAAVATAVLAGSADANPLAGMDRDGLDRTCAHYENRSRFRAGGGGGKLEFIAILADSCRSTLNRVTDLRAHLSPYQARLARAYLDRLTEYRLTVLDMNMTRFEEFSRLRPWETKGAHMTVTAAGEYLIARQMGLMDTYADWADEAGFTVAIQN